VLQKMMLFTSMYSLSRVKATNLYVPGSFVDWEHMAYWLIDKQRLHDKTLYCSSFPCPLLSSLGITSPSPNVVFCNISQNGTYISLAIY